MLSVTTIQAVPLSANFPKVCKMDTKFGVGGYVFLFFFGRKMKKENVKVCINHPCPVLQLAFIHVEWARVSLKSKPMTSLRCIVRNWFFHCEMFRAGMENEQILGGLCQDNGIIQIENERGQFSHILLSPFFSLSFYLGLFFPALCDAYKHTLYCI